MSVFGPKTTPGSSQSGRPVRGATNPTVPANTKRKPEEQIISDVKNTQEAYDYLISKTYLPQGAPVTNNTLATMVFQISQATPGMSKVIADAFRAIAFILEDIANEQAADSIAKAVLEKLTESFNVIQGASEDVGVALDCLRGETTKNTQTFDEFRDEIHGATEKFTTAAQEVIDNIPEPTPTQDSNPATQPEPSMSYAAKTRQSIPPAHAAAISKGNANEKQVLVERAPGIEDNGLSDLTEKELVEKAKTSLDLMGIFAKDQPEGTTFVAARKLRSGGIIYQLESVASAVWLRTPEVMVSFMAHFGGTSIIRSRLVYVVAEYVPRWWNENSQEAREQVERESGLPKGVMMYSKYIKHPRYHKASQKTAHAILGFVSREAANFAITHGLFMDGKRVFMRKLLPEPKRCMKCQSMTGNHVAAACKAEHDTCARCAQHHRTSDCDMGNEGAWRCANCEGDTAAGHGAADRQCPHFLTLLTRLHARLPETKYKFFPTDDPHSWELVDQADTYTNDQDATWQQGTNWGGGWTQARVEANRTAPGRRNGGTQKGNQGSSRPEGARDSEGMAGWRTQGRGYGRGGSGSSGKGGTEGRTGDRVADEGWSIRDKNKGITGYFPRLPRVGEETRSGASWGDSPMIEEILSGPSRQRSNSAPQGPTQARSTHHDDLDGPAL